MNLNGPQREQLHDALLGAFPRLTVLQRMVDYGLEENLEKIAGKACLNDVVYELIVWARAQNRIEELIRAALKYSPRNEKLRALAAEISIQLTDSELRQSKPYSKGTARENRARSAAGESVSSPPLDSMKALGTTVFFSYARKDKVLRDELEKHLSLLQRRGFITSWHEYQITPGKPRASEITMHLQTAQLILLLVSPDFIASDHCYSSEMKRAMERHEAGEAHVIPILLRPTAAWQHAPFGRLSVLPSNGRPITTWRNRDLAFVDIVDGIRATIEKLSMKLITAQYEQKPYRRVIGLPSPLHPRTTQMREQTVKDLYAKLTRPDTTAVVITGIAGAGKSTLANLVYRYAEQHRQTDDKPFTAEALWINIDSAVTMVDLVGTVLEALGKPSPYVTNLSGQELATLLFHALNTVDEPRLIVLDQFEHLLEPQRGHILDPGIEEWLHLLNERPCRCRLLLTSRVWPTSTHNFSSLYIREYPTSGLEPREGIELLRNWGIEAIPSELQTVVERWQSHPLALTLLGSLLLNQKLSLTTFLKEHLDAQHGKDISQFLEYIYLHQLDQVQRSLLFAFSFYRKPVPLSAAHVLLNEKTEVSTARIRAALDRLLMLHLLEVENE